MNAVKKFLKLARTCGHLALDAERKGKCGVYYRGKAAGYIAAARYLNEKR
jgi:hypothetical protein